MRSGLALWFMVYICSLWCLLITNLLYRDKVEGARVGVLFLLFLYLRVDQIQVVHLSTSAM